MTPFFLHFTLYDKARKHPIGGRVGLTYRYVRREMEKPETGEEPKESRK